MLSPGGVAPGPPRLERVTALVPLLLTGVRHHPPGRTDKNLCRCFGAPACRVFPDQLITLPRLSVRLPPHPNIPNVRRTSHLSAAARLATRCLSCPPVGAAWILQTCRRLPARSSCSRARRTLPSCHPWRLSPACRAVRPSGGRPNRRRLPSRRQRDADRPLRRSLRCLRTTGRCRRSPSSPPSQSGRSSIFCRSPTRRAGGRCARGLRRRRAGARR